MIVKDGEKFACEACIRGHRVSSCTHKDRKLSHVNKKGRPVSQCQHCRGLRKVRASHVKCDCGEHGSKNITLDSGAEEDSEDCHCQTGVRCTCALKKDHSDSSDTLAPLRRSTSNVKPTLPQHRSEGAVPRLRAPHPPIHRLNHAAHEHGQPYTVPKSRPMSSGRSSITSQDHHVEDNALQSLYAASAASHQTQSGDASPHAGEVNLEAELAYASAPSQQRGAMLQFNQDPNSSYPNLDVPTDPALVYNAISPGNPHRYSLNDFSMFTLDGMGMANSEARIPLQDPTMDSNTGTIPWPSWDIETGAFDFTELGLAENPITPTESVEHHNPLAPGLTRTTSGTNSDVDDHVSHHSDFTFQPNTFTGWEMPTNMMPDPTTDAFDADFGSYINVSSDAATMLPNDLIIPPFDSGAISQQVTMSGLTEQQQQQQQQQQGFATDQQYYPDSNSGYLPPQMSSSFKDEGVRQWLSQDQAAGLEFAGMAQHLENLQQGAGTQRGSDDGYGVNEPTWF